MTMNLYQVLIHGRYTHCRFGSYVVRDVPVYFFNFSDCLTVNTYILFTPPYNRDAELSVQLNYSFFQPVLARKRK
jgi:hypothetical protein